MNIVFWFLGVTVGQFEETNIGQALIISKIGINIDRVRFPLATGFNSFATLLGGLLTISLTSIRFIPKYKLISISSSIIFFVMLLLIDSRAAIIYPIIIFILTNIIYKKNNIKLIRFSPLIQIGGPILFMLFFQFASQIALFDSISRSSEEVQTGNSRSLIWAISISKFQDFNIYSLLGHGEYGHYASGASIAWGSFFGRFENSDLMHPHNTILMILFDYGLLGIIIYLYLLNCSIKMIIKSWKYDKKFNILIISYLLYFLIIGITESFFGFYYLNTYYLFFSVLIIQAVAYPYLSSEKNKVRVAPHLYTLSTLET
ncbi:O-antigen ligase family protein [Larkinella sp. VNQ87]|uniref:O-antigen ligase family protein n=1 Tax=Larkinella sp. VNQ87 TaxID=3400921 RepID=UPI003C0E097F